MAIIRMGFNRNPYLGAFALCTDKIALLPANLHFKDKDAENALCVPIMRAEITGSTLIGILAAGNSKGLVCSELFEVELRTQLEKPSTEVAPIPGKYTAFGNIILANDYGGIANPDLPDETLKILGERMEIPVKRGKIAGIKNVGAVGVATNRGALIHPDASREEVKLVEETLGVPADVGTACSGVKFVGLCMTANSNGAIVGMTTTGPELGRIESALGFI